MPIDLAAAIGFGMVAEPFELGCDARAVPSTVDSELLVR
jgi:hypothetical protein